MPHQETIMYRIYYNWILIPMSLALVFSLPIYVSIYTYLNSYYSPYINSMVSLISIYIFINIDKKFRFAFGFFVGLLWFYWIGLSFRFTEARYMVYIVPIIIAFIYAVFLWFGLLFNNRIFRGVALASIGYVAILGFDWFVPDAIMAFTIFKVDKISFCIVVGVITIISIKRLRLFRFLSLPLLFFAVETNINTLDIPQERIYLSQTNISQGLKWDTDNVDAISQYNIDIIEDAIRKKYDIVVLPETSFPMPLNIEIYRDTYNKLVELSNEIGIVVGAQRSDDYGFYNTTYVFNEGMGNFVDKVFLAPFGEYMPIPDIMIDWFNDTFKIGYSTFDTSATEPQNINVGGLIFRNAICYEGTTSGAYKENPVYMMLISNNAWFKPSIEPVLQMMLIKYYARLHKTIVFHSANGSNSAIITPTTSFKLYDNGINSL